MIARAQKGTRFVLVDVHFLFGENCNTIVVAELPKRDQGRVRDSIEDMSFRCFVQERGIEEQLAGLRGLDSGAIREKGLWSKWCVMNPRKDGAVLWSNVVVRGTTVGFG
jgi:hypothetical protein